MSRGERELIQRRLFPHGIPQLWCPPLTFFRGPGDFDGPRIIEHLNALASEGVGGLLVPGSTGEGWQMNDDQIRELLSLVLDAAQVSGLKILIGVLKTETSAVLAAFDALQDHSNHPAVAGFTVCPPKGVHLTQTEISLQLRRILSRGYPTALYQLPQVTENEMAAATVAELVTDFPNLILFKDTSGHDRVANAGLDLQGLFLVRGSEQQGYAKWMQSAGGPYNGLLLSTANVFASQLRQMLAFQAAGRFEAAAQLSDCMQATVTDAFALVAELKIGNPFTNANKLLLHLRQSGRAAADTDGPLLYSGERLPRELLQRAVSLIDKTESLARSWQ